MIKKIKSIGNFAVFKGFDWDKEVREENGSVCNFKTINVIYGRNYSGKTTLSRIVRAMETGILSDKFENPLFSVTFADGQQSEQNSLTTCGKKIRVFNEDFVRDNLRFITNPDESIEPFAVLGDDNNKIEEEIKTLEAELGSNEEGKETGLYAKQVKAAADYSVASDNYDGAKNNLDSQLKAKATGTKPADRKLSIKYNSDRFGNQNYNIGDIESDIKKVLQADYEQPHEAQLDQYEKLITEKTLQPIPLFQAPSLQFSRLAEETEALVTKKISESDKIEELVKEAVLNRWVDEGRTHHQGKRDTCAFCGSPITPDRWAQLEKHFDEESEQLKKDIDALIVTIEAEKKNILSALSINKSLFYSSFHAKLDTLADTLNNACRNYSESLEALIMQLKSRKDDIINLKEFNCPNDVSADVEAAWSSYEVIRGESDSFSSALSSEQAKAKEALRLKEVSDYLITIRYTEQLSSVENFKTKKNGAKKQKISIDKDIREKEELVLAKKRELNDEEKGAKKVNEYLNNFFGHKFLSLEAKKDKDPGEDSKRIRFEVIRDGKKAYHLSEGECSLLAFCYFLAKLEDIDTKDSKPIIWIDDPISSLDGNHIFFVYSLINAEIIACGKFEQLFVSTHSLDFLKYAKKLKGRFLDEDGKYKDYQKGYFLVDRQDKVSTICAMPKYLKNYVTEFNYLFHQIHKCAEIETIDDTNYTTFYHFGNNARKFFEIYLYYKYPDRGMTEETLRLFFGDEKIPAVLTSRINNEYSHLCGVFERGSTPVEVPEMQTAARQIIEKLKEDEEQYLSLIKSIGGSAEMEVQT